MGGHEDFLLPEPFDAGKRILGASGSLRMPPPFLIIDYILVMGGTGQVYMRESRAYGARVTIFGRARRGRRDGWGCADGRDIRGRAGGEKQGGGAMPGLGMSGFGAGSRLCEIAVFCRCKRFKCS